MSSPSIASYFNVRKRAAADDIVNSRIKVSRIEGTDQSSNRAQALLERAILAKNKLVDADTFGRNAIVSSGNNSAKIVENVNAALQSKSSSDRRTTRRTAKRTATTTILADAANKEPLKQQKIVKFTLGGSLSPRKKAVSHSPAKAFQSIELNASNDSHVTPAKPPKTDESKSSTSDTNKTNIVNKHFTNAKKELSFDEVKEKIGRSSRLDDLKAILSKRQQLEEQYQACITRRNAKQKANHSPAKLDGQSLKAFDTIELEVLSRFVFIVVGFF